MKDSKEIGYAPHELLPLVKRLTEKYTSMESSSVTYERANQLMEAVIYCIQEGMESGDTELLSGHKPPIDLLYEKGYQKVLYKTKQAVELYNDLIVNFEDYGCRNYRDTIRSGMTAFFLKYDARFAPQDHILTLDYPLMEEERKKCAGMCGIDLILFYLQCIQKEQNFLSHFEPEAIKELLRSIQPEYEDLYLDNICEPLMEKQTSE